MLSLFLNRRVLNHPTFGPLKSVRENKFWRGRIAFAPAGRRVWLAITATAGQSGPTEQQEQLYDELSARYRAILPRALDALHREYQRVSKTSLPATRFPAAAEPADLLRLVPLDEIWLDDATGRRFALSFQSRRHKDHDFHVFFNDWEVESVAAER